MVGSRRGGHVSSSVWATWGTSRVVALAALLVAGLYWYLFVHHAKLVLAAEAAADAEAAPVPRVLRLRQVSSSLVASSPLPSHTTVRRSLTVADLERHAGQATLCQCMPVTEYDRLAVSSPSRPLASPPARLTPLNLTAARLGLDPKPARAQPRQWTSRSPTRRERMEWQMWEYDNALLRQRGLAFDAGVGEAAAAEDSTPLDSAAEIAKEREAEAAVARELAEMRQEDEELAAIELDSELWAGQRADAEEAVGRGRTVEEWVAEFAVVFRDEIAATAAAEATTPL